MGWESGSGGGEGQGATPRKGVWMRDRRGRPGRSRRSGWRSRWRRRSSPRPGPPGGRTPRRYPGPTRRPTRRRARTPRRRRASGCRSASGPPPASRTKGSARRASTPWPTRRAAGAGANANPNAIDPNGPLPELGTYHYRFKVAAGGSDPLAAAYYPSKLANAAPAVILVHEREHSIKDFEESLADLKGSRWRRSLQKAGYAVMAIDLHGHGGNPRRGLTPRDWAAIPGDLELAYLALVDRHNRGELNLAKLGVIGLGEGANVAAAWAAGGGGVSSEGRAGDLGALVLISPMDDAASQGLRAAPSLTTLAARVPLDLMVGERDAPSFEVVEAIKPIVKRYRANQVETFPSALHAYQLLRLEPNLTGRGHQVPRHDDQGQGRRVGRAVPARPGPLLRDQDPQEPGPPRRRGHQEGRPALMAVGRLVTTARLRAGRAGGGRPGSVFRIARSGRVVEYQGCEAGRIRLAQLSGRTIAPDADAAQRATSPGRHGRRMGPIHDQ